MKYILISIYIFSRNILLSLIFTNKYHQNDIYEGIYARTTVMVGAISLNFSFDLF
jgi:hypothetical protein